MAAIPKMESLTAEIAELRRRRRSVTRFWRICAAAALAGLVAFVVTQCGDQYDRPDIPTAQIVIPADLTLGRSTPVEDPYYPEHGSPDIDVLHYGLDLSWDPGDELGGIAVVTLRATRENLGEITLDFAASLTATAVTIDGEPAAAVEHPGDDLVIRPGTPLDTDDQVRLDIHYHGDAVPTASPLGRDIRGIGFIPVGDAGYAFQEPFGAFTWFPSNDHPSDEALYDARFTMPDGWSAVTSGDFLGHEDDGAREVFRWQSEDPIATYVIALAFDKYQMHEAAGPHGIRLTFWYPDSTGPHARDHFDRVPEYIEWLEQRIGPYPFDSGGVVVVGVPVGMETQEMITLSPGAVSGPILVHELTHMWYGNSVTPRTWQDVWLNEGFAMYMQAMWESEQSGHALEDYLESWRLRDQQYRDESGPPGRFKPDHALDRNVYQPPAIMLHEIRLRLGDDEFFATLTAWAAEHKNTTQDRAGFTAWLNQRSGQDFTGLIADWLDSTTTPPVSF